MLSTDGFLITFKKERFVTTEVDNEMSARTRLTFYENLFIGQETSRSLSTVSGYRRVKRVEFRENA